MSLLPDLSWIICANTVTAQIIIRSLQLTYLSFPAPTTFDFSLTRLGVWPTTSLRPSMIKGLSQTTSPSLYQCQALHRRLLLLRFLPHLCIRTKCRQDPASGVTILLPPTHLSIITPLSRIQSYRKTLRIISTRRRHGRVSSHLNSSRPPERRRLTLLHRLHRTKRASSQRQIFHLLRVYLGI